MRIFAGSTGFISTAVLFFAGAPIAVSSGAIGESAVVSTMVESQFVVGDQLTARHRFRAAREVYDAAAKMVRGHGMVPVQPLRRIANAYYFEGRYDQAAVTLDQLAEEAALVGDHVTELWATADAAEMAWLGDADVGAQLRWTRVDELLNSTAFSDDQRAEISGKLMTDLTVFVPHLSSW